MFCFYRETNNSLDQKSRKQTDSQTQSRIGNKKWTYVLVKREILVVLVFRLSLFFMDFMMKPRQRILLNPVTHLCSQRFIIMNTWSFIHFIHLDLRPRDLWHSTENKTWQPAAPQTMLLDSIRIVYPKKKKLVSIKTTIWRTRCLTESLIHRPERTSHRDM